MSWKRKKNINLNTKEKIRITLDFSSETMQSQEWSEINTGKAGGITNLEDLLRVELPFKSKEETG